MGLGWQVVLQTAVPGTPAQGASGRAVLFAQHDLDVLAEQLGVTKLTEFVSPVPETVAAYLRQQGLDPEDFPIPDRAWFEPTEGLHTIRGLLNYLRLAPQAVPDAYRVTQDLLGIAAVLAAAEQAQVLFHLASDLPAPDLLT